VAQQIDYIHTYYSAIIHCQARIKGLDCLSLSAFMKISSQVNFPLFFLTSQLE